MSALPVGGVRRSPLQVVSRWWRDWTETGSEFACGAEAEVERIARDLGVSVPELRSIARQGPESADLLLRRMSELNLDPAEVARTEPATLHDLQRVCTLCQDHKRCPRRISRVIPPAPNGRQYCPNVTTLKALDAMPWTARRDW